MLVKALERILGQASWKLEGNDLSGLHIYTPNVEKPTMAQVEAEIAKIQAEEAAEAKAQADADNEILNSALGGMDYDELSAWIDNQLKLPDKKSADAAIDGLPIDVATKNVLKVIADAVIEEAAIIKAVARALVAALKKAGYIK